MTTLESITWPELGDEADPPATTTSRVNVAGKLRGMW
jgi:hypothetical protein